MAPRLRLAALLLITFALLTGAARADGGHLDPFAASDHTYPALDVLASHWAQRPVHVECASSWETWSADSDATGTWGYTWLDADWTRVQPELCEAALSIAGADLNVHETWFAAVAVHVITHESWHLREWDWRADEARVECRAIHSDRDSFLLLGATEEQAKDLYSWAWAFHVREINLFPAYWLKGCGAKRPSW